MGDVSALGATMLDGYYRIHFDGLALNGKATVLLENARIYGIKGEGQYDLTGRYRQGPGGEIEIELEVHLPGGTLDVSKPWLRAQPEVVALKFALSDAAQRHVVLTTADGPLVVDLERLQGPLPEQRGLEHL